MWKKGNIVIGEIKINFSIKVYGEPSVYGIDGGKISKLSLSKKGEVLASYDRGWDIKPTCEEAEMALDILLLNEN